MNGWDCRGHQTSSHSLFVIDREEDDLFWDQLRWSQGWSLTIGQSSHLDVRMEPICFYFLLVHQTWAAQCACLPGVFRFHSRPPNLPVLIRKDWGKVFAHVQRCACPAWWMNFTPQFTCFDVKRSWKVNIALRMIACPGPSIITSYRGYSQTDFEFWYLRPPEQTETLKFCDSVFWYHTPVDVRLFHAPCRYIL